MTAVQEHADDYANCNATPLAIAGQWPRELRGFAERNGIMFPLLVDKDRSVIKSYGVYHWLSFEAYNIARPATFIIDKLGTIRYMYIGTHQFDLVDHTEVIECLKAVDSSKNDFELQ
ncbi:redoxin domain-containing protein [Candidatus Poribacteria bacterium]|nr:redoxin domain-containing protein [Candidatus Poribacteria bacterium]